VLLCVGILKEIPANTYCCLCHYPAVFLQEMPSHTGRILRRFLCRFLRIAICAVPSPSHRRIASPPHRVAGELPTSLELHLPVVHPMRCTRIEEVEPQLWALGKAMMQTHVEVKGCDAMIQKKLCSVNVHRPMSDAPSGVR
jgi:hypothetical protein